MMEDWEGRKHEGRWNQQVWGNDPVFGKHDPFTGRHIETGKTRGEEQSSSSSQPPSPGSTFSWVGAILMAPIALFWATKWLYHPAEESRSNSHKPVAAVQEKRQFTITTEQGSLKRVVTINDCHITPLTEVVRVVPQGEPKDTNKVWVKLASEMYSLTPDSSACNAYMNGKPFKIDSSSVVWAKRPEKSAGTQPQKEASTPAP